MEFLIWLGFLIVYSIVQSLNKKKKGPLPGPTPEQPGEAPARQPTLQDALREIQEALQEASKPQQAPPTEPQPQVQRKAPQPKPIPQRKREPEFHSLEGRIQERSLEAQTKYSEKVYTDTNLESAKTYTDAFPETSFYDDTYSHAHMDATSSKAPIKKRTKTPAELLRDRLNDKDYLSEAFILQQIIGKPLSKKGR